MGKIEREKPTAPLYKSLLSFFGGLGILIFRPDIWQYLHSADPADSLNSAVKGIVALYGIFWLYRDYPFGQSGELLVAPVFLGIIASLAPPHFLSSDEAKAAQELLYLAPWGLAFLNIPIQMLRGFYRRE